MTERVVTFDAACYSVDAIERALYRMSARMSSDVAIESGSVRCTLYVTSDNPHDVATTIAEFRNEVLDETLRARIRDETREVRNLIMALAFSNTGLVDPEDA